MPNEPDAAPAGAAELDVVGLDHVVVNVTDVDRALDWYVGVLGLPPERLDDFRAGRVPFPSVRVSPSVVIDLDPLGPRTGVNVGHFCLVVGPADFRRLATAGVFERIEGPFRRWGARGVADSVYVTDPDGNVIELRHYGPSQLDAG